MNLQKEKMKRYLAIKTGAAGVIRYFNRKGKMQVWAGVNEILKVLP